MKYLKTLEGYTEDLKRIDDERIKITKSILKDIHEIVRKFGEIKFYYDDEFPEEEDVFSEYEGNNFVISDSRIMVEDFEIIDEDHRWEFLESIKLKGEDIICEAIWEHGEYVYLADQNPYVLIDILNVIKTLTPELMEERKVRRESHKFNF